MGGLTAPVPVTPEHDLDAFTSSNADLNAWLRQKALRNEGLAGRTYVVCIDRVVVGYYCLATGGASYTQVNAKLRRNMPDPIPMMVLGRLAVDHRHQGMGIGGGLLKDAIRRAAAAYELVGFRALVVHAKDDTAAAFYLRYGFKAFPAGGRTLFLPTETLVAAL